MGMSIDESLEWLISRKEHYEMDDNCQELAQALDTAIDIMRKYQKITEQVDIAIDKENFAISGARLIQIREIINGNDN